MAKKPLRSSKTYGKDGFIHRSWIKATGLPDHVFDGRPVIGIANSWSELVTRQVGRPRFPGRQIQRGHAPGIPLRGRTRGSN